MIIVNATFRGWLFKDLELIATEKAEGNVKLGDNYSIRIREHEVILSVKNISTDTSKVLNCTLREGFSGFNTSARNIDFCLTELIGRELQRYYYSDDSSTDDSEFDWTDYID